MASQARQVASGGCLTMAVATTSGTGPAHTARESWQPVPHMHLRGGGGSATWQARFEPWFSGCSAEPSLTARSASTMLSGTMKRLLILNCIAAEAPKLAFDRDVAPELGKWFGGAWDVVHLCGADQGDAFPDAQAYSHLILSGSELSAVEQNKRDAELCATIRDFVERGRRVLGICYGHQMLARALIDRACCRKAETPEFGWKALSLRPNALFAGIPELIAVHSHYDEVFDLPAPFRVIASTADCAVQAFAYGTHPVWGTQFHPEMTFDLGTEMLDDNLRTESRASELFVDELERPEQLRWNRILFQNFFGEGV